MCNGSPPGQVAKESSLSIYTCCTPKTSLNVFCVPNRLNSLTLYFQWSRNPLGNYIFIFLVCNSIKLPFAIVSEVHLLSSSNMLEIVIASIDEGGLCGLCEEFIVEFIEENTQRKRSV